VRFEIQRSMFLKECGLVLSHTPRIRWDAVRHRITVSLGPEMVGRCNRLIQFVLRACVSSLTEWGRMPPFIARWGRQGKTTDAEST
jgi:hypothetical protein